MPTQGPAQPVPVVQPEYRGGLVAGPGEGLVLVTYVSALGAQQGAVKDA